MQRFALIMAALIALALPADAGSFDAGRYLKERVVTRRLPNGITVVLLNRGYAPVLAFDISFRVGSVNENYDTTGAAHLLEHMLFKGTDRIGTTDYAAEKKLLDRIEALGETIDRLRLVNPGNSRIAEFEKELAELQRQAAAYVVPSPYDRLYTEAGGVGLNASTSRDKTGYYVELPADRLELWARTESERLRNPVLREFYLERSNVVQERLMSYDSRGTGLLFELFMAQAFIAHPYRHPVIGWRTVIPNLRITAVRDFYWRYYTPGRMTITVVGRQDVEATYRVIEKYFGAMERRPDPPEPAATEPPQMGERRVELRFEANPYLVMGWHKPALPHRDDYLCDVMAEILATGKSSRLYRRLVIEKNIASSVSAWSAGPGTRYANHFIIFATPRPPHGVDALEKAILAEMDDFFSTVSAAEIARVVTRMEAEMVFGLGTNKGLASLLAYYQTVHHDWRLVADYLQAIRSVTPDDLKALKQRYFTAANRTVGILTDTRAQSKGGAQ